ncbi:RNA polymerase II C-terminal domain phosphatase-like, partial [Musa troglodytarum]
MVRSCSIECGCVRSGHVDRGEKIEARSCSIDHGCMRSGGREEVGFRVSHYPSIRQTRLGLAYAEVVLGPDSSSRDVRQVLKGIRHEILQGCKIVFSRVFPSKSPAQDQPIWKMAERLGATCCTEVDPSVTHVVSMDTGTQKSRWALQNEKFLIFDDRRLSSNALFHSN